jgi:hypothetical protein
MESTMKNDSRQSVIARVIEPDRIPVVIGAMAN